MSTFSLLLPFAVLLLGQLKVNAVQLRVVGANQPGGLENWDMGPILSGSMVLCPDDLPDPFTIACIPSEEEAESITRARFFVNGVRVRTEQTAPYVISGDDGSTANAYQDFPIIANLECRLSSGAVAEAMVEFLCVPESPSPSPSDMGSPSMTPSQSPVAQSQSPTPSPSQAVTNNRNRFISPDCIRLGATSYESISGWAIRENEIEFEPGNDDTGISGKNFAPVQFKFIPQRTSIYAIAVDMTTRDRVDHNDVWLGLPGVDFTLWRESDTVSSGREATGTIKGFHNSNRRQVRTLSIDFNGHVLSSRTELENGKEYTVFLGGRSTMVIVHNIVLVPCDGTMEQCSDTTFRRRAQNRCSRAGL